MVMMAQFLTQANIISKPDARKMARLALSNIKKGGSKRLSDVVEVVASTSHIPEKEAYKIVREQVRYFKGFDIYPTPDGKIIGRLND